MIEVIKYRTDEERTKAVDEAQKRGLMMLTDKFIWTGLIDKDGEPIIEKTMEFGNKDDRLKMYGPDIVHKKDHAKINRKRELHEKMQEQDLSNQELNELMRLRA